MENPPKSIKPGDSLYMRDHRNTTQPTAHPVTVDTVGRKFFTLKQLRKDIKFRIDTLAQVTTFRVNYRLFRTAEEYAEIVEKRELIEKIRRKFHYTDGDPAPLETLRTICQLLNI